MKKIAYQGWPTCWQLSNGKVDLVVTGDVGPRVIRFGFSGGANEFKEYAEQLGGRGEKEWRIRGGHRLWHAPEAMPRTYWPDNAPVEVTEVPGGLRAVQPIEGHTGIQKELELKLDAKQPRVSVTHRLTNRGVWPVPLAPWALTVMAPGGTCIIPQPPRGEHPRDLLPCQTLTLWPYTNLADPRWTWGRKYILLRQESDAARSVPQKLGAFVPDGWAAYSNGGRLFVKAFHALSGAAYPDSGCCFETFTNHEMLEVETLGPRVTLEPGGCAEHLEEWWLAEGAPAPKNDADAERDVLPEVKRFLRGRK
jgi:hypothetical protein